MSKAKPIGSFGKSAIEYKKALIYCRVSSDRQKTEGHGLESQEKTCREYADRKGYEVEQVFQDSFTGGGNFMKRPAMSALISYVDKNPHTYYVVIFDDLSRFARDVTSHFKLRHELDDRDVRIECPNFTFEDTPEGELIETLLAAQHQYHRKNNGRQVIQRQRARLLSGYWAFGSKRGYQMVKDPTHGKISGLKEPDASHLREAIEGFASGLFVHKVDACEFLVEKGFWKKQSSEKYIDKFTLILKDPFYAGFIEFPAWEVERRDGKHEGIISIEVFEAVQKRLKQEGHNKRTRINVSEDFPLRGLLSCAGCEKPLTAAWSRGNGGKYGYYFCQNKDCEYRRVSIKKGDIEVGFKKLVKKQALKDEVIKITQIVFDKVWEEEIEGVKKQEALNQKTIEKLEGELKQFASVAAGTNSENVRRAYEDQIESAAIEIEELKARSLQRLDLDIPYRTALNKATGLLKNPYKIWESVDVHEKQRLFFFLYDEKLPYSVEEGYRTDRIPSAVRLFEEFVTANSQDVEMVGIEPTSKKILYNFSTGLDYLMFKTKDLK